MKIRSAGDGLFHKHADRFADMTKVMVAFRNFANAANAPKKLVSVPPNITENTAELNNMNHHSVTLTFRRRMKSRLPFAGIIRRFPYSTRFQDEG